MSYSVALLSKVSEIVPVILHKNLVLRKHLAHSIEKYLRYSTFDVAAQETRRQKPETTGPIYG